VTIPAASLRQLSTATRFALLEQLGNRLALVLLLIFAPLWYVAVSAFSDGRPVAFRSHVAHAILRVNGHHLTLLTAGLDAITLIVGFMMFTAARRAVDFDRRLVMSGFSRAALLGARLIALAVVATVISLYAVTVLDIYWPPWDLAVVWLGFLEAGLAYGALGLLLGVLVRRELEGFFAIIMLSLIDTFIQNPIGNPAASKGFVQAFPAFAPTQVAVAGGFTDRFPVFHLLFALAWPAGLAFVAITLFGWHARIRARRTLARCASESSDTPTRQPTLA
jgi:hypothetical protein